MKYCRVCNVEDFDTPEFVNLFEVTAPEQPKHRKAWEIALAYHTIMDAETIQDGDGPRYLGVGAGRENTIFLLTNMGEVHATDMYAEAGMWHEAAPMDMLRDPKSCAPAGIDYNLENLIVQHMDARRLRYPDNYFDAAFSSSSIEHFGTLEDIAQAAWHIGRVLKPGGVASISTEYKISGPGGIGIPGVVIFDEAMLRRYVIEPSGLELVEPLDLAVSESTLATAIPLDDCVKLVSQGKPMPEPHVVLTEGGYVFTSIHIALRKPL